MSATELAAAEMTDDEYRDLLLSIIHRAQTRLRALDRPELKPRRGLAIVPPAGERGAA